MADTVGQAELIDEYPVTSGLTAGTTRQHGRVSNLVAEEGSVVNPEEKKLLN